MDASLFTFAYDIADEGAATVVNNIATRAGANEIVMATLYHAARDIFPHGRAARLRYLEPGSTFFRPDPARYQAQRIQPRPSALVSSSTPLEDLVAEAARHEIAVRAWIVYLHHDRIDENPEFAPRTAFGDPIRTNFCISHPEVRAYARALTADVASRGVTGILAEALHFVTLEHGGAHERYLLPLGPQIRFLMGLCFCKACLVRAREDGIDGEGVRRWVATRITRALETDIEDPAGNLERDQIAAMADGDLGAYLTTREQTVTSAAIELREAADAAGVDFTYVDPSGAALGFATGRPAGAASASIAWRYAIDLPHVAAAVDEVSVLAYAADPDRVATDLTEYRNAIGSSGMLSVALRPTVPDSTDVGNLRAKVRSARSAGARRVDFYHYGLMRLDALDRIRAALEHAGPTA